MVTLTSDHDTKCSIGYSSGGSMNEVNLKKGEKKSVNLPDAKTYKLVVDDWEGVIPNGDVMIGKEIKVNGRVIPESKVESSYFKLFGALLLLVVVLGLIRLWFNKKR